MRTRGSPISENCTGIDVPFPEAITGGVISLSETGVFIRAHRVLVLLEYTDKWLVKCKCSMMVMVTEERKITAELGIADIIYYRI